MSSDTPVVLIVDDNPAIASSLCSILKLHNFEVDTALNGSDAFRKIRSRSYDVVLCDIEMPGMSGLDFLESVRKETHPVEVILMTGYLDPDYYVRAIRLGAADFINKPFETQHLMHSITRILERNRSRENSEQLLQRLEKAELNCVINPGGFFLHGITKAFSHFMQFNLKLPENLLSELLICVDEMLNNALIHGTLGLTSLQRNTDHRQMQELIAQKLAIPEIAAKRIRVYITLDQIASTICIRVEDDGEGFDHERWLKFVGADTKLNMDEHGRGLAMLYHLADTLTFFDGGRSVQICRKLEFEQPSGI